MRAFEFFLKNCRGPQDIIWPEDLRAKYGGGAEAEGFKYDEKLAPSITFSCKQDKRNLPVRNIEISPLPVRKTDKEPI